MTSSPSALRPFNTQDERGVSGPDVRESLNILPEAAERCFLERLIYLEADRMLPPYLSGHTLRHCDKVINASALPDHIWKAPSRQASQGGPKVLPVFVAMLRRCTHAECERVDHCVGATESI